MSHQRVLALSLLTVGVNDTLTIRLLGQLKAAAGADTISLALGEGESLRVNDVLVKLPDMLGPAARVAMFGQDGHGDPRERMIILKNDRDIGVLDRLDTSVADGDELTFIPVAHGG